MLVFAAYQPIAVREGKTLDQTKMFACLTLLSLLAAPMVHLFQALPELSSALACFGRIQEYLNLNERSDYRKTTTTPLISTSEKPPALQYPANAQPPKSYADKTGNCKRGDDDFVIVAKNAFFGIGHNSEAILKDISCEVKTGEVVMIVGPTGSGKSSLLRAFLGEMTKLDGSLKVSSARTGYCDQTPWLTNRSIRDNIVGTYEFEETWFNTVVHACVLDDELQHATYNFRANIGSKGGKLSGGQKQRLVNEDLISQIIVSSILRYQQALARAVYARSDIFLLDDVLSGLDRTTEDLIFSRLFGPRGVFTHLNSTVVLATHARMFMQAEDFDPLELTLLWQFTGCKMQIM